MKNIIPYEKDIKFDTKISEITSISLEHEEKVVNDEVVGNFIVSGDYKVHQISINKEDFSYKIPFSIELPETINKDTIEMDINDFTYDIKNNDTLVVKIEMNFSYEDKEDIEEVEERNEEIKDAVIEVLENDKNEEEIEENNDEEVATINNNIINNISNDNTYITYHIYVVNSEDTIDLICQKFNITKEELNEYNEIDEIKSGDKLLIPIENNE